MAEKTKKKVGHLLSANKLKARYPSAGTALNICIPEDEALWLPSRILAINHQLQGGLLYGHILELYGEENVGKTLLAMDFAYVTQYLGGVVLWADAESTFNGPWAQKNGLDLSRIILLPLENRTEIISDWLADTIVYWRSQLKNNEPILLVIDSLAAMETMENLEKPQADAKAEMGNRAKALDMMLRRRNPLLHRYGICGVFINQLRSKIGASKFEDPDTTPGGKAMRFYASQRVGLFKGKQIKNAKDIKVGRLVYCRLHKTKVGMPMDNIQAEVYFRETDGKLGYSKYHDFHEILMDMGIIRKSKSRYYYKDKMIANGEANLKKEIAENDKLRRKLIRKSGIMTPSIAMQRLENTKVNLYPVNVKKSKDDGEEE